jgi:deoxycytidine triphosphate deaminase
MSVLSERDIIEELGRDILIYPFKQENLIGCCLWLTASEYAYSVKLKELLVPQIDPQSNKQFFNIPKGDTVLVWTNESVSLGNSFCGSVHSKVGLVAKGLGHIGTKVNPNWSGILALALHNLSDLDTGIQIDVGETIAYLRLYRLESKSSSPLDLDSSARLDILPGAPPPQLVAWINDRQNLWRKGGRQNLEKKLRESPEYKAAKDAINQQTNWYWILLFFKKWAAPIAVSVLTLIYLLVNQKKDIKDLIVALIPIVYAIVSEITKTSK